MYSSRPVVPRQYIFALGWLRNIRFFCKNYAWHILTAQPQQYHTSPGSNSILLQRNNESIVWCFFSITLTSNCWLRNWSSNGSSKSSSSEELCLIKPPHEKTSCANSNIFNRHVECKNPKKYYSCQDSSTCMILGNKLWWNLCFVYFAGCCKERY